MYKEYNPNPFGRRTDDCTVRAISMLFGYDWDAAYLDLMYKGLQLKAFPDKDYVWGAYLLQRGFKRCPIPDTCPLCYTLKQFCDDHPEGRYVVATQDHVIAVIDGDYYDTWDSGDEVPNYYWKETDSNDTR
jgi:hypothetical protein